jgi:3-phosphoshikimate 1-carboxyvinyltransferase
MSERTLSRERRQRQGAENLSYPDELEIVPLRRPPSATVRVPGSKSITNRALVLASLTQQPGSLCELEGALCSDDTLVMVESLKTLGFAVDARWPESRVTVGRDPTSGTTRIPRDGAELFVANSGTTMRFLTALVSLGQGRYRLDGDRRMRERPIQDLLDALGQLGARAHSERPNGCPPVVVEADGLRGGRARIRGDMSSQFLSALLMAAPFARTDVEIELDGPLVSRPYISMTLEMMRAFGLVAEALGDMCFRIPSGQTGGRSDYAIEPDASAASYFLAAAAITGGRVTVLDLPENSLQGDVRFADVLGDMGCRVERCSSGITVHGRRLHGVEVDMNDISDTVMTLAAAACFAQGPTTIRNVAHIRHKETDRLAALAGELRKVGAAVEEYPDGLKITPGPLHGATIETYNDHRMAMSMALVGLGAAGIVIKNPACVAKTYPGFFDDLETLRDAAN